MSYEAQGTAHDPDAVGHERVGRASVDVAEAQIKVDERGRFLTGTKGGPGRQKGSRNKLGEQFIQDVYQAWQLQGNEVIQRVIRDRPADFLKIIANILPKDVNIKVNSTEDLSDDQLMRKLAALTEMAKPLLARLGAVDAHYEELASPIASDPST